MPRETWRNLQYTSTNDGPCPLNSQPGAVSTVHTFGGRGSPSTPLLLDK